MSEARWPRVTRPEVGDLLDKAGDLEDAGKLPEALRLYQKALCQEPEHLELRQYIDLLNRRVNAEAAVHKYAARQEELARQLAGEAPAASLQVAGLARDPAYPVRGRQKMGAAASPPPKLYAEELRRQVAEQAAAREAAKAREAELERKEVMYGQVLHAADRYRRQVGGGNDKLAMQRDMQERMEEVKRERMRKWELENAHDPLHVPQGPLLGMGEIDAKRAAADLRHRNAEWHRQQARIAAAAARPWDDVSQAGASYMPQDAASHMRANTPTARSPQARAPSQPPPYSPAAYQPADPFYSQPMPAAYRSSGAGGQPGYGRPGSA
eukprot:CAMPEP_0202878252 /NCGR_PEP_ID=MMETSP1391-20130828/31902_1 /ASSEMBLY_ACC=CAM_ASM_000867 /TAXON_ID=1034604 /ORGANISM="Chlamydomonas leiostraca, Strain SAG 11-49" /LENGTH=324 /DNA_ID=CAMNT_0049560413 /DNA_START=246 /DNA_END=1217 /DNA_ORIENTATION=+